MSPEPGKNDVTQERILDAAEALFAEKGFEGVSVREITGAAGCNVSAVNYHFGNKQNLHLEVFRRRWLPKAQARQEAFRRNLTGKRIAAETIVEAMARAFLEGHMSDEERSRYALLMLREIARPTEAFDMMVEDVMKPFVDRLKGLLRDASSRGAADEDSLALDLISIFSMVLYFNVSRPVVSRVTGREYDEEFKAQLVRHIVDFSLHGLEGRRKGKTK